MSKHLGPYALEAELGRGGMGTVYRARDTRSGRAVALKTLTDVSANLAQLERFRLEAEALRGLVHPHLVEVLDLSLAPPQPYAVFELVEGETLAARVKREGPLPWPTAARIASEVASGVAAAHERGLLHRDLKPDNVLLGPAGAKLADFGLVKDLDRETLTQSGATLGTPSYMAPEQIGSQKDRWGPPTDVYGLAATLYFALTGRPPFTGPTTVAILHAVLQDAPPQPSALAPDVPRWLDAVCLRGLAKENAERFPSAIAFRLALLQPAAAGDGRALRRALALSAGVALLGLAGLGLALALPQRSADPPTPAVAAESSLAPVPSGSGEKPLTAAQSAGLEVATKAAVQGALWLAVSEIRDAAKAAKTADQVTRLVERVTKCRGTLSRMSPPKRAELEAGLADAVWSALQRLSKKPEDYRAARAGRLYELLIQDDQPLSLELLLALIDHLNRDTDGVFPPETFPAWGDRAEALLRGLSGVEQGPRWVLLARLRLQQTPPAPRDAVRALREALEHDLGEGLQLEAARLAERAKNFPLVAQVVEPLRGKRLHPSNRPEFERLCLLADGDPRQVTKSTVTTEASLQSFLDSTQGLVLRGPTPAAPLLTLARSALGAFENVLERPDHFEPASRSALYGKLASGELPLADAEFLELVAWVAHEPTGHLLSERASFATLADRGEQAAQGLPGGPPAATLLALARLRLLQSPPDAGAAERLLRAALASDPTSKEVLEIIRLAGGAFAFQLATEACAAVGDDPTLSQEQRALVAPSLERYRRLRAERATQRRIDPEIRASVEHEQLELSAQLGLDHELASLVSKLSRAPEALTRPEDAQSLLDLVAAAERLARPKARSIQSLVSEEVARALHTAVIRLSAKPSTFAAFAGPSLHDALTQRLADVPAERLRAYLGAFSSDRAASLLPSEAFDAWFQRAEALSAQHEDLIPALRHFRSRIPAPPQPANQADR